MENNTFHDYACEQIEPWLETHVKSGKLPSIHQASLQYYYAIHPNSKGSITIIHGFCEFFGKYHEMFYEYYKWGYSVFFVELRGHGLSSRDVREKDAVYVKHYDEYIEDVKNFTDQIVLPNTPNQKHFLFSHSMGGCVSALYLAKYPGNYDGVIFSSPMFEINYRGVKPWQIHALEKVSKLFHLEKKLIPNANRFTGNDEFEKSNALCKERYLYQLEKRRDNPNYHTWSATYGWTIASKEAVKQIPECANKIEIPILLLQAGHDTTVENSGQDTFASISKTTNLITFPSAKHELYNSDEKTRNEYYTTIHNFLETCYS